MKEEIERKFEVKRIPFELLDSVKSAVIKQGYIILNLRQGKSIRLRKTDGKVFHFTIKTGSGMARPEFEVEFTEEQCNEFWPLTKRKRVRKIRYCIPYEDLTIELDIYQGSLKGMATAEIEFKSVKRGKSVAIPEWFGREVTGNSRYSNQNLAVRGIPRGYKFPNNHKR